MPDDVPAMPRALTVFVALTCAMAAMILAAFVWAVQYWSWVPWVVLPFAIANTFWICGGAATAVLGLMQRTTQHKPIDLNWRTQSQTAVLITLCGEDPKPLASYLDQLTRGLSASNLCAATRVFVLSDTYQPDDIAAEHRALAALIETGRISYRRRTNNAGKKPANIAQWLDARGDDFDFMLVQDSDSRMTVTRIERMIWQLEQAPDTGLLQAGIALVPGRSRFGRHQRNASRLLSRNFGRGFAAWSGTSSNYWGHNAIMRIEAFRAAARLPHLSGRAPFGGPVLSHDFIEAAWIKRAGWGVTLDPDASGSAEDAPQTFGGFFKRDRRWCQGNLQHVRKLAEPGLHPISRLHLILGIFSYLAAPIWLFFVGVVSVKALSIAGLVPFVMIVLTLLVPKICALIDAVQRAETPWRRRIFARALLSELAVSTVLAPLIMMRQTAAVGAVFMGKDAGWKSGRAAGWVLPLGLPEAIVGLLVLALAVGIQTVDAVWLAPIFVPLICAPILMRAMEGEP